MLLYLVPVTHYIIYNHVCLLPVTLGPMKAAAYACKEDRSDSFSNSVHARASYVAACMTTAGHAPHAGGWLARPNNKNDP